MRRSWALCAAIATLYGIPVSASATGLITWAWHLSFAGATDTGGTNPTATDRNGNFYFAYVAGSTLHLRKLSPAENLYFDVSVANLPGSLQGIAPLAISPPVAGTQYLYLSWMTLDSNNNVVANVVRYNSNGIAQWPNPTTISNGTGGDYLLATSADSVGNTHLALQDSTGSSIQLKMADIDASGAISLQSTAFEISPQMSSNPFYDSSTGSWVLGGADNVTPGSARWGSYRVSDSSRNSGNTFASDATLANVDVRVSRLPGGRFAVIHNVVPLGPGAMPAYDFTVYDAAGNAQWQYPAAGSEWGYLTSLTSFGVNYPVYGTAQYPYAGSTLESFEQFGWNGGQNWRRNSVPADALYPMIDGFILTYKQPSTGTLFLEHGLPSGTLDWAHHYSSFQGTTAGFAMFGNAFYVVAQVPGALVVDRFVTGVTIKSLTCPPTTLTPQNFTLTLTLNAPAPVGGLRVALSSSDPNVTFMQNGAQVLLFTVAAGQISASFVMDTKKVQADVNSHMLAIQNGVRCNAETVLRHDNGH